MSKTIDFALAETPAPSPTSLALTFPAAAYARLLRSLYPPGKLLAESPTLDKLNQGFADELARVDARAKTLLTEADPRTAVETLADWERMLGLPDEFIPAIPTAVAERQAAVAQKFASRGGQSYTFFEQLCALCGRTLISITTFHQNTLRCLTGRVLDRVYGTVYAHHMIVTASAAGTLAQADFERVIRRATHAHITVSFVYV